MNATRDFDESLRKRQYGLPSVCSVMRQLAEKIIEIKCQRPADCAVGGDPLVMQRCDALKDVPHIIGTVHVISPSRNVHVSVMLIIGMHDAERYRLGLSGD
jgi:hypothetical protein